MDKLKIIDELFTSSPHGQVNIVMIQRAGLTSAIVCDELEQCEDYWINKRQTVDGWWWTTYQFLMDETGLSKKQIMEAVKKLSNFGIIETSAPKYEDGIKKKHYKMNYTAKDKFIKSDYDGSVSRSYNPTNFIIYNKELAKKIGPEATLLIRDMCRSYIETAKRNNLLEGEWFECRQTKLATKYGVVPKTMCDYIKKMIKQGIIETKQMSWPKTSYVKINFNKLLELYNFGTWQEVSDFLENREEEKAKKKANKVELITRSVLDKVKKVSGQQWNISYDKLASIEARLNEGITEDQLLQVVEDRYKSWLDDKELFEKYFNWDGVIGSYNSPSTVRGHLDSIRRKDIKEQKKLEAEKVCATICNKMYEHSKGEIEWTVDNKKIESIRVVLGWKENFSEDDLIQFAIGRYDFNKKSGWKMTAFNTLFSNKEKDNMLKARNVRQYEETKKLFESKKSKGTNKATFDGVSTKNDLRGKIDQNSITGVQGQDYF